MNAMERWVIDLCYLKQWRKIAVCCHDSTVSIYDCSVTSSKSFEKAAM